MFLFCLRSRIIISTIFLISKQFTIDTKKEIISVPHPLPSIFRCRKNEKQNLVKTVKFVFAHGCIRYYTLKTIIKHQFLFWNHFLFRLQFVIATAENLSLSSKVSAFDISLMLILCSVSLTVRREQNGANTVCIISDIQSKWIKCKLKHCACWLLVLNCVYVCSTAKLNW